jgi:hypothetical protein
VVRPRLPDEVTEACRKHHHGDVNALIEQYPRECNVLDAEQVPAESRAVVDRRRDDEADHQLGLRGLIYRM